KSGIMDSQNVRDLILKGLKKYTSDNPVKSSVIEKALNISGVTLREEIHYLRTVCNEPIGSNKKGYFYARSEKDLEHFYTTMLSRARHIHSAAEGAMTRFRTKTDGKNTPSLFQNR